MTLWMIEAGKFSHDFQIIKVLERRYNTHDQAANLLSPWLFIRSNKKLESLALNSLVALTLLR
jgi:hypothetical protein